MQENNGNRNEQNRLKMIDEEKEPSYLPGGAPTNRWLPGGSLLDGAHHDLNKAGLLPVIQGLLHGPRLLQQQVRHALPVLHHVIALNQ